MLVIKSLLIFFLAVITIIKYGSAPRTSEAPSTSAAPITPEAPSTSAVAPCTPAEERAIQECEDLMVGMWYEDESDSGLINFRKSYEELTYELIYDTFKEPPQGDESPDKRESRLRMRDLFTDYFMDLKSSTGFDFSEFPIKTVTQWCKEEVVPKDQKKRKHDIFELFYNDWTKACADEIKELFEIEDTTSPHDIFRKLYENWNVKILNHRHESKPSTPETPVDNYPLQFFRLYQRRTLYRLYTQNGKFRTIHEYCVEKGKSQI